MGKESRSVRSSQWKQPSLSLSGERERISATDREGFHEPDGSSLDYNRQEIHFFFISVLPHELMLEHTNNEKEI
jgi:hypothetical protein